VTGAARVLRAHRLGLSVRFRPRTVAVSVVLAATTLVAGVLSLAFAGSALGLDDVLRALAGDAPPPVPFIVEQLRLPRALTAILVGGALGVSGAIIQQLTRNPLGSPDVIGFTEGAAAAAVLEILLGGGGRAAVAAAAVAGGLLTAAAVYGLAFRGGVQGYRLVLIGIGIGAALTAFTRFLIGRAEREDASAATVWLLGSLNSVDWGDVTTVAIPLALLLPAVWALGRRLRAMELGDDAAASLGVPVERSRWALIVLATGLAAVAVAAAGPIAFVALAAPQLARRLTRASGPGLGAAGLMGALVLLTSDFASQLLFGDLDLPAGVITGAGGGAFLVWLLWQEWRRA
jgi:iron complex transport system permease protein